MRFYAFMIPYKTAMLIVTFSQKHNAHFVKSNHRLIMRIVVH